MLDLSALGREDDHSQRGQASILLIGGLAGVLIAVVIAGALARAVGREAAAQRAADLAAVAGAKAMHANYGRLFEPALTRRRPNPRHLTKADYLALGRSAARAVAAANGAPHTTVSFPDERTIAPVRIKVAVRDTVEVDEERARILVTAEAQLGAAANLGFAEGGGYDGPLAYRQGKPMRPDVAQAFDRLEAAAKQDGVALTITSGYRSDAEQAVLFARNPDPRMVAPPGKSLHRNGTELDLGPPAAYGWLAANARRFHFTQRYSWEPWHYGYTLNARSTSSGGDGRAGLGRGSVPGFVPQRFAPALREAAQRWNVSATLLAAQIYAESNFNPFVTSPAGAQGIAQFMPATARQYGLDDPFDATSAINAQAHMMRDLLRQFGSVPLALAAYNAGPGRVQACGCVPNIPETQGYVARILGLMSGAGQPIGPGDGTALEVRLVS
ncbi:transglycosylase SLT domain-containing protein [Solirubrobacter sp. CPCC 204708]|uniref:Transglycosylase SLT domain-containing protein n=1 Tax=Solirubrobacter deserti TaxID=2282478 RepID=A0ABT4RTQ0_9ACTN|nr:transglycosylase SLT domain-containing protein [Solirubrobacter deserti]MBE2320010.1 transglycosylase SLT domain-containing protein [Solirubrobacter deserti]MDA0141954.1 transglycosylase SLT domain-containing protein [Solirubrobacter deserti]